MNKPEMYDIYDIDRQKTGREHMRGVPIEPGDYHLVVHICIFNSDNQLLIQQRQPFKKGWPDMWDVTAGGFVTAGESSRQAAEREVFEEIGLKIDLENVRPLFSLNFRNGFDDYYILRRDVNVNELVCQKEEVAQVKWADRQEVIDKQNNGTMIPYYFLEKLFDMNGKYCSRPFEEDSIKVGLAGMQNIESWMSLINIVKNKFPGMETVQELAEYRETVIKFIGNNNAICATHGNRVVGVLLFSDEYGILCFMAVHPEFRRKGIATDMVNLMLEHMDRTKDIKVETYRDDDPDGEAARAFYESIGFVKDKLTMFENKYPEQQLVLKAIKDC